MAKSLKNITEGRVRDKGRGWFPELVDKSMIFASWLFWYNCVLSGRSIKIHLYWAMKNCEKEPKKLRQLIDNIPRHYQVLTRCKLPLKKIILYIGWTRSMSLLLSLSSSQLHNKQSPTTPKLLHKFACIKLINACITGPPVGNWWGKLNDKI